MNPYNFQVIFGTLVYQHHIATYTLDTYCSSAIEVPPNDARSCDIVFELPAGTVHGTLEYDNKYPPYRAKAVF